jgi:DNA-binding beta-propeller fold protein YncE
MKHSALLLAAAAGGACIDAGEPQQLELVEQPLGSSVEIADSTWTLIGQIAFADPRAAHWNPRDGQVYAARRAASGGLYRIDADGAATQVAVSEYPAGVLVDPVSGDTFFSEDHGGALYRVAFGGTGRQLWVAGFHSGDDDPVGMALAAGGAMLVVDRGYSGPDEIWRFSPATAEGEVRVHADNGTLIDAVDVTVGASGTYVADAGNATMGRILALSEGGVLTTVVESPTLTSPVGIAADPITGELFVLDADRDVLVRVDPATGTERPVLTGLTIGADGWAGVDVSPDGATLVVTDAGADTILVLERSLDLTIETESSEIRCEIPVCPPLRVEAILGTPPYTWSLAAGGLPAGMTLHPDGLIDGAPVEPGSSEMTVRVTDAAGQTAEKALTYTVAGGSYHIVEPGWRLTRNIRLTGAVAAHYNPVDGNIYAGVNDQLSDGVFRIDAAGNKTRVAQQRSVGGLAIDPADGDVFATDHYDAYITRIALGATSETIWVSGFGAGDDDPLGIAIAPPGYAGPVVAPGNGIVADLGHNNDERVWRWSPSTSQGETLVRADDGTLVEPKDVAFAGDAIYVADAGPPARIHRLDPGGVATFAPPMVGPTGLVWDPVVPSLLVADARAGGVVVRFDPATGRTSQVIDGLIAPGLGGVDLSPDGARLLVTDHGAGRIYEFTRDPAATASGREPDRPIRLSKVGTSAVPGRMMSYYILVENLGTTPVVDYQVTEYIESWFYFAGADPRPASFEVTDYEVGGGVSFPHVDELTWTIDELPAGGSVLLSYDVALNAHLPDGFNVYGPACGFARWSGDTDVCFDEYDANMETAAELCRDAIEAIEDVDMLIDIAGYAQGISNYLTAGPNHEPGDTLDQFADEIAELVTPFRPVGNEACVWANLVQARHLLDVCLEAHGADSSPVFRMLADCNAHIDDVGRPRDPNEMQVINDFYIRPDEELAYVVHYENMSEDTEARDIYIDDTLDPTLDLDTVAVSLPGGESIPLAPGETLVLYQADRTRTIWIGDRPITETVVERWTVTLDPTVRTVRWTLQNVDLPPRATGSLGLRVRPLPDLPTNTEIRNAATIQFEVFEPITTNQVLNVIDAIEPAPPG